MKKKSYITVTDQFCGAGGSSLGATAAGAEVRLALNHWPLAIQTHNTNFPDTDHDCTDISACDPRRYPATDILITSPECTNHSLAKGVRRKLQGQGRLFKDDKADDPAADRSRATMWDVVRFAECHQYNLIIVENVVDAWYWVLFNDWLKAMDTLGYAHEMVFLNSMFAHPTPQSRDRMYVVFHKRGNRAPNLDFRPKAYCPTCAGDVAAVQAWKNPAKRWGRYGRNRQYVYCCPACAGEVMPYYYCAANAIDWALPAERIGDRQKPLKPKTLERVRVGLKKYGQQPFLADLGHTHAEHPGKVRDLSAPCPTQTGRQTLAFILSMRDSPDYPLKAITDPLPTQSTEGAPFLVELHGSGRQARPITDPLGCVLAGGGHFGLVQPFLVSYYSGSDQVKPVTEPVGTVCTHDRHALVMPFIVSFYTRESGAAVSPVSGPWPTQPTWQVHYLAQWPPVGIEPTVEDCYFRMLKSHEIGRAMAFPQEYVVLGSERDRVRQYGNAVTPPAMKMIFERCLETLA